jgi:hypothetical protein
VAFLIGAGVLAVVVLAAAVVVALIVRRGDHGPTGRAQVQATLSPSPTRPTPTPTADTSASDRPTAEPSEQPSVAADPLHDPCVIGTWTETSHQSDVTVGDHKVRFTGHGAVQRFSPDGTTVLSYGSGVSSTGTDRGTRYEFVYVGSLTFNFQTSGGTLLYSNARANGTSTLKVNGSVQRRQALVGSLEPERYTCSGDSLREFAPAYTVELTRIGPG